MKALAESSARDGGAHLPANLSALLVELHAHARAAVAEARQVARLARQIEGLVKSLPDDPSRIMGNTNEQWFNDNSQDQRAHDAERAHLIRFCKLL